MCTYWYDICPFCHQGRLFVYKNISNNNLYLHCEECERGWLRPEDTLENNNGFLTILEEFDAIEASFIDIKNYGWSKYALHEE